MDKRNTHLQATNSKSGITLFIREIAHNPGAMGAAWPSSKHLANSVAAETPTDSGLVIELGAGTGVVTEALLERGIKAKDLIAIERSPALAQHLRHRFNQLTVIQGDAQDLYKLLGSNHPPIGTIVSGLPLRSLPGDLVKEIGYELDKVMPKGSLFVQFTYCFHLKPKAPSPSLKWIRSKYIWRNLPPARIDLFRYEGSA